MLKKLHKIFAISIIFVMLMAVTCYAENAEVMVTSDAPANNLVSESTGEVEKNNDTNTSATSENEVTTTGETAESTPAEEEPMLEGDLYLLQSTVDYKRIVDGNAYILGDNITLNSVVGGDVFILGNAVTIGKDALIYGNLYVLSNSLTIDGYVYGGDLYAVCSEITISEGAAVNRDMRVTTGKLTLSGGLGRNAFIAANEISMNESAKVYGDFNYSSKEAIQVPSGAVQGTINFNEASTSDENSNPILAYVMNFAYVLVLVLATLGVLVLVAPKFLSKIENVEFKDILPSVGFGALGLILPLIVAVILFITVIGMPVGFALISVWSLLALVLSTPIAVIAIAGMLADKLEALKKAHNILAVIIVSLVVWAVGLIPFVGGIIALLVDIFGLGLIVRNIIKSRKAQDN